MQFQSFFITITIMKINIWNIRYKKNVTLVELAKLTNISKSTLDNFEIGRTIPNMLQMEQIAIALDAHITDLFDSDYK